MALNHPPVHTPCVPTKILTPYTVVSSKPSKSSAWDRNLNDDKEEQPAVLSKNPATLPSFSKRAENIVTLKNCKFGNDNTESDGDYVEKSASSSEISADHRESCEQQESEIEYQSAEESQSSSSKQIDKLWKKDPWSALQQMVGKYFFIIYSCINY